jgi:hypothetical protein
MRYEVKYTAHSTEHTAHSIQHIVQSTLPEVCGESVNKDEYRRWCAAERHRQCCKCEDAHTYSEQPNHRCNAYAHNTRTGNSRTVEAEMQEVQGVQEVRARGSKAAPTLRLQLLRRRDDRASTEIAPLQRVRWVADRFLLVSKQHQHQQIQSRSRGLALPFAKITVGE